MMRSNLRVDLVSNRVRGLIEQDDLISYPYGRLDQKDHRLRLKAERKDRISLFSQLLQLCTSSYVLPQASNASSSKDDGAVASPIKQDSRSCASSGKERRQVSDQSSYECIIGTVPNRGIRNDVHTSFHDRGCVHLSGRRFVEPDFGPSAPS